VSYLNKHIGVAEQLLTTYSDSVIPFQHYLKHFFAANKKYGSKDRKQISNLCYAYLRLGKMLVKASFAERMELAIFLSEYVNQWVEGLSVKWQPAIDMPVNKKLDFAKTIYPDLDVADIFSLQLPLSIVANKISFCIAHLKQQPLFLRLRPGKEKRVEQLMQNAGVSYQKMGTHCLQLPANTKLEGLVQLNADAVVQDYASQQVAGLLQKIPVLSDTIQVWDACTASGGKSILVKDILKSVALTVSDVRTTILKNLQQRFAEANMGSYDMYSLDLALDAPGWNKKFDLIVCDVPCSGSGTWGRSPEKLSTFIQEECTRYSVLQTSILNNVLPSLKQGGYLLYITCSVFKIENEDQVSFLQNKQLTLLQQHVIEGWPLGADTLFAALLQKQL
jgi:16S rRNA (cytosine967-C5)-methyltransferase